MDRRYPGIRERGNSIVIDFCYRGERCRETLRIKPTKSAIQQAFRKREAVLHAIAMGAFDYAEFFPDSNRAMRYANLPGQLLTVESALKKWLKKIEAQCQLSTARDYRSIVYYHLIPKFGSKTLSEIATSQVEEWCNELPCTNKRINNILTPLRQIFSEAFYDGLIEKDPLSRVKPRKIEMREPQPFSEQEIELILDQLSGQNKNIIQFAFWSGLRTSELISLRWRDIDFKLDRFYVRTAKVRGKEKTTKTSSGLRTVQLNTQSIEALQRQKKYTEENDHVFHDSKTGLPWSSDQAIRKRVWMPALKRAGIKYRNPYQTRHTFASLMLSREIISPMELAQQMGHKDWGMLRKVYARWIPNCT